MRKLFAFIFLFVTLLTDAQTEQDPVVWKTSVEKISDTEYNLIFEATILKDWHLYSQYNPDLASLPLEITASDEKPPFELLGKASESQTFKEYSDVWTKEEIFFKDKARLVQKIKLTNKDITTIKLNLFAQVCKDVCINLDDDYVFSLTGEKPIEEVVSLNEKDKQFSQALRLNLKNKDRLKGKGEQGETDLWTIFFLGFVGGLLALLTPCVFPMIPLTVSFFTKQSQNKAKGISNAILYGLFIVVIYLLFSLPFHFLDSIDPEILNTISTNVWLNIFFFAILVFFAFSFFGYYELTLPNSWGSKMDNLFEFRNVWALILEFLYLS